MVDNSALKRGIDTVYATYLPKNMHPFVYLSLEIDSRNIDVNVHPMKQEVQFLNQEQIIAKILQVLETKLLGSNNSRVFYTQVSLSTSSRSNILYLNIKIQNIYKEMCNTK